MKGIVAVTGASGTLGRRTVERLAAAKWIVVGIDRAPLPDNIPTDMDIGGVDLADEAAMAAAAERIRDAFGRLDALVNVAGGFHWETISDGDVATWDRLYTMNVKTALVATRALLPLLRVNGGAIVNVGAAAAVKAAPGMGAYAASKAGVARLTEALAEELKDANICRSLD